MSISIPAKGADFNPLSPVALMHKKSHSVKGWLGRYFLSLFSVCFFQNSPGKHCLLVGLASQNHGSPERRDRIQNRLFQRFPAIAVNSGLILFPMGQVAGAADASVDAGHAFNEIGIKGVSALFE